MRQKPSLLAAFAVGAVAVENGLARTPQMVWNNWNTFACDVSESLLLETSQILIDSGLRDVGYTYVVLDDCWSVGRGADGNQVVDEIKFPRGMEHVSKSLHAQNLLFGMYSSAGEMTCARYPGSLDYETQDAESFAKFSIDYLKYDNCYHMGRFGTPLVTFNRFNDMAKALKATGRSILYSLCSWGEDYVHTWGPSIANSWRISGNIYDSFARPDDLCGCNEPTDPHHVAPGTHCSVLNIINKVAPYTDRSMPGGWSDLDMLEVGLGGMTDEEYKAHFSMWAALKSPLLLGNDLREMNAATLSIITNPVIIAISQDPRGKAVMRIIATLLYLKTIVIFFNTADTAVDMSTTLDEVFVMDGPHGSAPQAQQTRAIHDLWAEGHSRMNRKDANAILEASLEAGRRKVFKKLDWYNPTEIPYIEGLAAGDERVFGVEIGKVTARGRINMRVERHAAKVFRLRSMTEQVNHIETNYLSPTASGAVKGGQALQQTIADVTAGEHELGVWEAIRLYKPAVIWAMFYQLCVIMEGYDTNLLSNFFAYPSFLIRYGHWVGKTPETPTGYQMTAAWQAGLSQGGGTGSIVGCLIAGLLVSRYGSKKVVLGALTWLMVSIFVVFFAPSLPVLVVGEILCGLPWGVLASTAPAYASEVLPTCLRTYMTSFTNMSFILGQLISAGVLKGLSTRTDAWGYKIPFALQWFWPLVLIPIISFSPESPWYLVRVGRMEEAEASLNRLKSKKAINIDVKNTLATIIYTDNLEKQLSIGTRYIDCFRGVELRRTEIACMCFAGQILCGICFAYNSSYFFC
ncbi:hypothetical protein LTR78_006108 [Recurvomyces mirabilis]|uniref:alpha-galactosidase n=1 Tax=Recurvomyces mirabilis TaxID=574656 RepID=A0AAE0WLI1_9PEZI|nr:hypothetical protein LTR78_006108 [Recurvomyces mirabilis]KAK5151951.1 hypothetical protein LTS14_008725 [Recurvomyces mirabilis]